MAQGHSIDRPGQTGFWGHGTPSDASRPFRGAVQRQPGESLESWNKRMIEADRSDDVPFRP